MGAVEEQQNWGAGQSGAQTSLRSWMPAVILGLSLAIIVLDTTIVNVALPSIQRDFAVSVVGLEWISATCALVFGAFILIWGRLGTQFGSRWRADFNS